MCCHIFPGSGANYQGTRKVIFNQWPRPRCSYASDGHILECLGGEGRGTLSVWVEFQAPSLLNSGCLVLYDYNDFDFKTRFRHHLLVMITVVNCSFYVLVNLGVDQDICLNLEMYHKQVIFVREIFFSFSSVVITNETILSHCKVLTSVVLVWEFDNSLVLMYYADLSYLSFNN